MKQRGGVIMKSRELNPLARFVKDAIRGLRKQDVLEMTKLKSSTYDKLARGERIGDPFMVAFAQGIEIDLNALYRAAAEAEEKTLATIDPMEALEALVGTLEISQAAKLSIIRYAREQIGNDQKHKNAA